jgi:methylated-DNA-[protein]-cysteine S-methyltransferase
MKGMNMIYYTEFHSPLGNLVLAATSKGLSGLYFEEHKYFAGTTGWQRDDSCSHLRQAVTQLDEYFSNRRTTFDIALDLAGTPFQRTVWDQLTAIPFGRTETYGMHARRIGKPEAVRAVGGAIGRNPVSIIVPCHRVIGMSGALAGYAGGLERKRYLLALEASGFTAKN